jgi:hypothetical protein
MPLPNFSPPIFFFVCILGFLSSGVISELLDPIGEWICHHFDWGKKKILHVEKD